MAYSRGDMDGSGPFYVGIDVWWSGVQDRSRNSSRFDWAVYVGCDSNGWGTFGVGGTWACSIGGNPYSGPLGLDFRPAGSSARRITVATGQTWISHDGDGKRAGFRSDASASTNHSSIGYGESGPAWVDAPRIAQPPTAPRNLTVEDVLPTSLGVRYAGPADDRGAGVTRYLARWYEINGTTNPVIWDDYGSVGYTNPRNGAGPILKPGTDYHVYISAENSAGMGPAVGIATRTLAGGRVKLFGAYRNAAPYVKSGGVWKLARSFVKSGGSWRITA